MPAVFVRDVAKQHEKAHPTELPTVKYTTSFPGGPLSFSKRVDPGNEAVKCTVCLYFPPKLSQPNEDLSEM